MPNPTNAFDVYKSKKMNGGFNLGNNWLESDYWKKWLFNKFLLGKGKESPKDLKKIKK